MLFLIEFYTNNPENGEGGYDINFAWVHAEDKQTATEKLKNNQGKRFDEVIQITEQPEITPLTGDFELNTNLFILN